MRRTVGYFDTRKALAEIGREVDFRGQYLTQPLGENQ
jgi:hypothetical protein